MKRPSFQFYVGDWQSNSNLRRCTFTEKGIWLDVMCLMHDGEEYGLLRWPLKEIAQAVGCKLAELKSLVTKGVLKGADVGQQCEEFIYTSRSGGKDGEPVTLLPTQPGPLWYSSRMVKDDHVSKNRGKGTRFGEQKPPPDPAGESPPTQRVGTPVSDEPRRRVEDGPSTSVFSLQSSEGEISAQHNSEAAREKSFFERCFELATAHFPNLMTANFSTIYAWESAGYDFERHVRPAMESAKRKGAVPRSFNFFTGAIGDAANITLPPALKAAAEGVVNAASPEEKQRLRAWYLRNGIQHKDYNPEGLTAKGSSS